MMGLPELASEHGGRIDSFIAILHWVMAGAFLGWGAWFALTLLKFRRKKNPHADYTGLRSRVPFVFVGLMALIELALLLGLSLPFWDEQIVAFPEDEDPFEVRVIAQQFQWNIHYPGPDGEFGRTDPALVDDELNSIGLDFEDPRSEDDVTTLNQLHLPVSEQVVIHLSSKDMIHSMFLPEFRIKQDAIPGMRIPVHFTPTMTTTEFQQKTGDEDRDFEIACAQLCGITHYTMRGFVTVETEEEYQAWFDQQLKYMKAAREDDWL